MALVELEQSSHQQKPGENWALFAPSLAALAAENVSILEFDNNTIYEKHYDLGSGISW